MGKLNATRLFEEIHGFCVKNQDPALVQKYSRYFKEGYPGYGLPKGMFDTKVKTLAEHPEMDLALVLETAPLLLTTGKYEETSFAIALTIRFHKQFMRDTFREIEKWFGIGISNWAHTDYICSELLQLFFKKGFITYLELTPWRTAANKFQRRAVPVSLIKQLKVTERHDPFLEFLDPMMADKEREVHQGLGWFLREAWKRDPMPVETFLLKWRNSAARLIFQYATEKMTPDQKKRFKKV